MTATELWWLSLAIGGVVIVVVAVLLGLIIAAARSIDGHAARIWSVGKEIASNTVSIWILEDVKQRLTQTHEAVKKLERTASSVKESLCSLAGKGG